MREVFADAKYEGARDAELALYEGFLSDADRPLLARVRGAAPDQLGASDIDFHDTRYRELLFRYRARYAPETLSSVERDTWKGLCDHWLKGNEPGLLNINAYKIELDRLEAMPDMSEKDKSVLQVLREWGEQVIQDI